MVIARNSNISNNFADDSGGGIYIDTGDQNVVNLTDSYVESNMAHGEGCGMELAKILWSPDIILLIACFV